MSRSRKIFMFANIALSLLVGTCIYVLLSPDVAFVSLVYDGSNASSVLPRMEWQIFRNYVPDMLWAYALVFAVTAIMNGVLTGKTLLLVLAFSALMEIIQIIPGICGTFDPADILVEGIAAVFAAIMIISTRRR